MDEITERKKSRRRWFRLSRDTILFALGLAIVARCLIWTPDQLGAWLMFAAALLGMPIFLRRNGI